MDDFWASVTIEEAEGQNWHPLLNLFVQSMMAEELKDGHLTKPKENPKDDESRTVRLIRLFRYGVYSASLLRNAKVSRADGRPWTAINVYDVYRSATKDFLYALEEAPTYHEVITANGGFVTQPSSDTITVSNRKPVTEEKNRE